MKEFVEKRFPLSLDLQLFGKDDEKDEDNEDKDDDDAENDNSDENSQMLDSLDDLLKKHPRLKQQYEDKIKSTVGKRLKKFEGIDIDKARELLKQEQDKEEANKSADDKAAEKALKLEKELTKLERKEKVIAVKEVAIEKGMNPKLVARLIDYDKIEKNDADEFEIEEALEELAEEFPELFRSNDEGEDDEDDQADKKRDRKSHKPGAQQRTNNPGKKDRAALGRERALVRHKKAENQ